MSLEFRIIRGSRGVILSQVIADTGADASAIPWSDFQLSNLNPAQGRPGRMQGVAGGSSATLIFRIWVYIDGQEYPCRLQADFVGSERILGQRRAQSSGSAFPWSGRRNRPEPVNIRIHGSFATVQGRRGAPAIADATTILVLAILFVATFIRSAFGFGKALVAVPILALIMPVELAAPVAVLVSITVAAVIIAQDWRHVHFRSAGWLVLATLFGTPLGLLLLTLAPSARSNQFWRSSLSPSRLSHCLTAGRRN